MTEQGIDKASSFEAVRARLLALAYRMLGSRAEAEDVVQDVGLKWHLADTQEVQIPAAWLTTITTRVAIDRLRRVQRERASQAAGWLPEPWLDEVAPSAEELALRAAEMSYGVMLLLERLKPDERAAFVLHEAFRLRLRGDRGHSRANAGGLPADRPSGQGAPATRGCTGGAADPAAHARIVERLRTALEAQDRVGLLRLFSDAPEVVSDAPVCAPVSTSEPAVAGWMDTVTSLVEHASNAETVSVAGTLCIALLFEGDVVGVLDVSTNSLADGSTKIVALRVVTSAARLRAANRMLGRAAVTQLLARIQQSAMRFNCGGPRLPS